LKEAERIVKRALETLATFMDSDRGLRFVGMAAGVVLITSVASFGAHPVVDVGGVTPTSPAFTPQPLAAATASPTASPGSGTVAAPTPGATGGGNLLPNTSAPDFGLKTQGITNDAVKVGISYNASGCGDSAAIESLLGPSVTGDIDKSINTFARHINDTGGIGGRKYTPVIVDDGGAGCPERNLAAAVEMADEQKVFMAVPGLHVESDYIIARKIPVWGGRDDPASLAKYGPNGLQLLQPIEPTLEAWASFGKHYLKTHTTNNPPCLMRIESGASGNWDIPQELLIEKLKKHGITFRDIIVFKDDVSTAQQQANAAAIRARDKGCKQAWFMAGNPLGLVFVTYAATANNWFPTWTWTAHTALIDSELAGRLMDPAQWERAIGLSYRIPAGEHPKEGNCKKIYMKYNPGDGQENSAAVTLACMTVLPTADIMRRAIERTGRLDANTLMIGADSIKQDAFYDAHVPIEYSFPDADGPFRTRGFGHWTVADWSSSKNVYEFPAYPCYYEKFEANGGGCQDLRQTYK
jgi:hypothetical protein